MEKQIFCPLPYLTANWVTVSRSVTLIHITHVMVIIFQTFWVYRIALFIKEISFLWQIMNVSQHADISLVHPLYCGQVAPGLHSNSWHLDLTLLCPSCLTVFFFVKSLKSSGEENKLSLYNLWPCPFIYLVASVTVAWVAVRCCAVLCIVCPSPTRLSCHLWNYLCHKVCKFLCQNVCAFWEYIVWKSLFLWTTQSFCQLPHFLKGCKI